MSLEKQYRLDWDDIANLFTSLNTQRNKFQYNNIEYPNPNNKIRTKVEESIKPLVDSIDEMLSNNYIKTQASNLTVSDIQVPSAKDRMYPDIFNQINQKIEILSKVCFGFNGSGFNASNFSHSTCFENVCSAFRSGFSFTFGANGGDGGANTSLSSCTGFQGTNKFWSSFSG